MLAFCKKKILSTSLFFVCLLRRRELPVVICNLYIFTCAAEGLIDGRVTSIRDTTRE